MLMFMSLQIILTMNIIVNNILNKRGSVPVYFDFIATGFIDTLVRHLRPVLTASCLLGNTLLRDRF